MHKPSAQPISQPGQQRRGQHMPTETKQRVSDGDYANFMSSHHSARGQHFAKLMNREGMTMRKPIVQRIAELEERKRSLMARLSQQQRARDTRRKILLGSFVLHHVALSVDKEFSLQLSEGLRQHLANFLTRDQDKELFDDILESSPSPASPVSPAVPLPDGVETEHGE